MAPLLTSILILLCVTLQTGLGLPLSDGPDGPEGGDGGNGDGDRTPPHVRTKRCSCTNQLDSECHYFCHLDIIWVNTPSKTTVYGLGSALSRRRRRRSVGRCSCAHPNDHTCTRFCLYSAENPAIVLTQPWSPQEEKKAEARTLANERAPLASETSALANERVLPASKTSALANGKVPPASRPGVLSPQKASGRARSELLALIRELIHANSLVVVERPYPPGERFPGAILQKPAYR